MIYKVMQSPLGFNTHTNTQHAAFVAGLIQFVKVRSFQRRGGKIPRKKNRRHPFGLFGVSQSESNQTGIRVAGKLGCSSQVQF